MSASSGSYGAFFPYLVVVTHFFNIFLMLILARSGLEVLAAFPKFYWNDDCPPGREWLRLSKKTFSADSRRPWSSLDEEVSWSSFPDVLARLPWYGKIFGGKQGARSLHFLGLCAFAVFTFVHTVSELGLAVGLTGIFQEGAVDVARYPKFV